MVLNHWMVSSGPCWASSGLFSSQQGRTKNHENTMSKKPTPTATTSIAAPVDAPQASAVPVAQQSTKYDEADYYNNAPRRYFASPEDERAYYIVKDQQETITASLGWDGAYEAKVSGTQRAQSLSSAPQPVVAPVVASAAAPQASDPTPTPAASNTLALASIDQMVDAPCDFLGYSEMDDAVTLEGCNIGLNCLYANELAELAALGAHVQVRAVCAPGEVVSASTRVLLTVKDGLVGGATGPDGELTFTFLDVGNPKVELGSLTASKLASMAQRFLEELPLIKDIYQARANYIAATGASPTEAMPDVEEEDLSECNWFMSDSLPKTDESRLCYPLPRLLTLVDTYTAWADNVC